MSYRRTPRRARRPLAPRGSEALSGAGAEQMIVAGALALVGTFAAVFYLGYRTTQMQSGARARRRWG